MILIQLPKLKSLTKTKVFYNAKQIHNLFLNSIGYIFCVIGKLINLFKEEEKL